MDSNLARAEAYIQRIPGATSPGGHKATLKAALAIFRGFDLSEADGMPIFRRWNETCLPPWSETELQHKRATAENSTRVPLGYLAGEGFSAAPLPGESAGRKSKAGSLPVPPALPKWPPRNLSELHRLGHGDLICPEDLSLWSPAEGEDISETAIDALFCGGGADPLICVGDDIDRAITARRSTLRGTLRQRPFIVPSAMSKPSGLNQKKKPSVRCLDNVGPRRFLVIECDFSADKDGVPTAEAPLLASLADAGRSVADLCAAVLFHLAGFAPLAMVVSSGGKSLHGWFFCQGMEDHLLRPFMRYAVSMGADPMTWTPCQFVRMPGGIRSNGRRQSLKYFNPEVLRA